LTKKEVTIVMLFTGGYMNITDYSSYFQVHQDCAFATVHENLPYVRPMALLFVEGEFYITTGKSRNKVKHLMANSHFSLYLLKKIAEQELHIQGSGTAQIVHDAAIKSRVFQAEPMIGCYWQSPEHPDFTLFKLNFTELYTCE
jgi:general stress protein 26